MRTSNPVDSAGEPAAGAHETRSARVGIFATLAAEYDELARLMAELASIDDDAERRRELFTRLAFRLAVHADAEDAIVYAALASYPETTREVRIARREHAQIESLVEALRSHPLEDASWLDGFLPLEQAVQQHIRFEQRVLFACVRAVLSDEASRYLDERYRARHDAGKTHL